MTPILTALFLALLAGIVIVSAGRLAGPAGLRTLGVGLGILCAAGALWALIARQAAIAIGLAGLAMALLRPLAGAWRARPTPGRRSEIRTSLVAMELDHDTGAMTGTVLAGAFAGRSLDDLSPEELDALLDEAEACADTRALLAAYLERRGIEPGGDVPLPDPGAMSEADALGILGLEPGAGPDEIRAAHRRLMRRVHPDLGGSPALAALLNAARRRLDPD